MSPEGREREWREPTFTAKCIDADINILEEGSGCPNGTTRDLEN
jgi:hypothetical protein